ncbi:hypothetical protein E2C01_036368 [Portunus trituberculatus]|uniref:Uncharacterized protein n=1 Tax=Portunus trituberculatus TaxID=210409 RepID=A0A5B7FAZ9_PORTR|nr:hypothetical protein [Portunus trituberculatus]
MELSINAIAKLRVGAPHSDLWRRAGCVSSLVPVTLANTLAGRLFVSPGLAETSKGHCVLEGRVEPGGLPLDVRVVVGGDERLSLCHQSVPHPNTEQPGIPGAGKLCQWGSGAVVSSCSNHSHKL